MGLSGMLLKKERSVNIHELIHDINMAAINSRLETKIDSQIYKRCHDGGVYTTANIANTYDDVPGAQQWLMYIYSEDNWLNGLDWFLKNEKLMRAVVIEDISGCEEILLDFLYEYLKLNPNDYFYDELKWYYTYEDIVSIKQKQFDPLWCYKDPKLL